MANWKNIKNGVSKAADKTAKKASELADAAALRIKLRAMNAKLSDKYETLGRLTYKQLKSERSQAEKIAETIEAIDKLREDAKALKKRIEDEKNARRERPEDIDVEAEESDTETDE